MNSSVHGNDFALLWLHLHLPLVIWYIVCIPENYRKLLRSKFLNYKEDTRVLKMEGQNQPPCRIFAIICVMASDLSYICLVPYTPILHWLQYAIYINHSFFQNKCKVLANKPDIRGYEGIVVCLCVCVMSKTRDDEASLHIRFQTLMSCHFQSPAHYFVSVLTGICLSVDTTECCV